MSGEVNIPLLRKAVEWAEAEAAKPPELCEWLQQYWVTPHDLAAADQWGMPNGLLSWKVNKAPECGTCYCIAGYVAAVTRGPGKYWVEEAAREELGLTAGQSERLFHGDNSIEKVRRIAEELAGERL